MNITWNAKEYKKNFQFVPQYGEDVLNLLHCGPGAFAVDLGCGNGALSAKLAERGYYVLGVDASREMLEIAAEQYPDIRFMQGDACTVQFAEKMGRKADVIFSNAVLHWIDAEKQEQLIRNLAGQLKTGGEFVCEFGGKGCAETVHSALEKNFAREGLTYRRSFYFPTIGEYAPILEKYGFRVEYATLFDRPTEQKNKDGLREWINMFVKIPFEGMDQKIKMKIIDETEEELRDVLFHDGKWYIDYVRIRFRAVKMREV